MADAKSGSRVAAAAGRLGLWRDASLSALAAGFIAVLVAYAGPLAVVFQAAEAGHLSRAQVSSWILAISVGSGLTGILLSLRYRVPVIAAWSTPGAALLVTGLSDYTLGEAVGAYLLCAVLVVALGVSGVFGALMRGIPQPIVAGMLAGILLSFGLATFTSITDAPALVCAMVGAYLVGRRFAPRYAIVAALVVGFAIAQVTGDLTFAQVRLELARPQLTAPQLSLGALVNLGIPLFLVTMASQNAPGVAVLRASGYDVPADRLLTVTGVASGLLAPLGAHTINLAAITAAICTGPEAHADPDRRYVAGLSCGSLYLLVGAFGATLAALFAALPRALVAAIAGLALIGSLATALSSATEDAKHREAAVITFLITASGVKLLGIGAAFWGLAAGILVHLLLSAPGLRRRRQPAAQP